MQSLTTYTVYSSLNAVCTVSGYRKYTGQKSAAMISAFTQKVGHASEKHIVEGVAKEERARSMPNQTENAFLKIKKKSRT